MTKNVVVVAQVPASEVEQTLERLLQSEAVVMRGQIATTDDENTWWHDGAYVFTPAEFVHRFLSEPYERGFQNGSIAARWRLPDTTSTPKAAPLTGAQRMSIASTLELHRKEQEQKNLEAYKRLVRDTGSGKPLKPDEALKILANAGKTSTTFEADCASYGKLADLEAVSPFERVQFQAVANECQTIRAEAEQTIETARWRIGDADRREQEARKQWNAFLEVQKEIAAIRSKWE